MSAGVRSALLGGHNCDGMKCEVSRGSKAIVSCAWCAESLYSWNEDPPDGRKQTPGQQNTE